MRVMMCLLFAAAACGGSTTSAPPPAAPATTTPPLRLATQDELDALKNRMCECTDDECTRGLAEEMKDTVTTLYGATDWYWSLDNCKKSNRAIVELTALRERACTCDDTTCADGVQTEYDAFLQAHRDTIGSESQAKQIGNVAAALVECLGKRK